MPAEERTWKKLLRTAAVAVTVPCVVFWAIYAVVVFPWIVPADSMSGQSAAERQALLGLVMLGVSASICRLASMSFRNRTAPVLFACALLVVIGLAAVLTEPTLVVRVNRLRIPALLVSAGAVVLIALVPKRSGPDDN